MSPASRIMLRLGHSPDPDDAFMWWPLFEREGTPPRISTGRFRFVQVTDDIESLNQRASAAARFNDAASVEPASLPAQTADTGRHGGLPHPGLPHLGLPHFNSDPLEITAMSCAQYPFVRERYAITACGASMGENYGPKLVAAPHRTIDDLKSTDSVIAVPGERTSAFAALNLMLGRGAFQHQVVPFDQIIAAVASGEFAAGLVIHEGQLTFEEAGLRLLVDLGAWWMQTHNLALPLGVNAIRRDLDALHGPGTLREVTALLRRSVEYALAHRDESIAYSLGFARGMTAALADRFIAMYVNRWTLDFGATGRQAVATFLEETHRAGLTPEAGTIDFIAA